MTTLIKNGLLIDPANQINSKQNLFIANGKIAAVTADTPAADRVIDADGKVVCPGFIDLHMHEDPVENGHIYRDEDKAIFACMLRQGVTSVLAGNCGLNVCDPGDYLDLADKEGTYVNVAMMAGLQYYREEIVGIRDRYAHATPGQCDRMALNLARALARGCAGISYGVEYAPGIDREELLATAAPCQKDGKLISAHVRSDSPDEILNSIREIMALGEIYHAPVQISHIGSMAGFDMVPDALALMDRHRANGLDVLCDCYPYEAFSTHIGSSAFDDLWLEKRGCGYDVLEIARGQFQGQRATKELFDRLRREDPRCLVVCHSIRPGMVDAALTDPAVILASDGLLDHGSGHPRAAGTFPRFLAAFVRSGKVSLYDAVAKMTAMPARRLGLSQKGRLNAGADADVVIFDPDVVADRATFQEPVLPPVGIEYVLMNGELAMQNGKILRGDLGRALRK